MKAASPQIDSELKLYKHAFAADAHAPVLSAQSLRSALDPVSANNIRIFLPENGLGSLQLHNIPLCSAGIGQREDPTKSHILERSERSPGINVGQWEEDVRDLTRKLTRSSRASAWEKCLYQHSSGTGEITAEDYIMQHDIYSLGVCLLELGLWESFVMYDDKESHLPNDGRSANATRTSALGTDLHPSDFKNRLLSLARGELKSRMGSRYSEVVVTCLTCLDPGNADFGDEIEFQDEDGIQVGVRYIEKVSIYSVTLWTATHWQLYRLQCDSIASVFETNIGCTWWKAATQCMVNYSDPFRYLPT